MNKIIFQKAINTVLTQEMNLKSIGTLSEKTLHAVVKNYYEENQLNHEIKINSYFVDIYNQNGIIEIQTKQFNMLRKKLAYLLEDHQVRVVYPTFYQKYLIWLNPVTFEATDQRLSPKKGSIYQIFPELYKIKFLLNHPNLRLSILLIDLKEYRLLNGWSKDLKKGSHCHDRIPIQLVEEVNINNILDYLKLIPDKLPNQFTSRDFARLTKLTLNKAQIALNVLASIEMIIKIGKMEKFTLYEIKR